MKVIESMALFRKLSSSTNVQNGRLLGLDVGQRYVGLAISDVTNQIASPLSVLVRKKWNIDLMARDFQTFASEHSVVGFVVGYPFKLHRQTSAETVQVRLFMDELHKTGRLDGLTYAYWDENYTTKCVEALLEPLNLHPIESKTVMDIFAAVGILQMRVLLEEARSSYQYQAQRIGCVLLSAVLAHAVRCYVDHLGRNPNA